MGPCENKPSIDLSFLRKCLLGISNDAKNKGSRDLKKSFLQDSVIFNGTKEGI